MLHKQIWFQYLEYLEHLAEGGERVELVIPEHVPARGEGLVYASALGRCPLKSALQRQRAPYVLERSERQRMRELHVMQQGVRDAEVLQEAIKWAWGKSAEIEYPVESRALGIRGRVDALIHDPLAGSAVIEIKRREGDALALTDVLQTLAYGLIMSKSTLSILLLNRWVGNLENETPGFTTWFIQPEGDGYIVVNEHGQKWYTVYNTPEFLNVQTIERMVAEHRAYLEGEKSAPPYPDFINRNLGAYGNECFEWANGKPPKVYGRPYKGALERVEYGIPACPYFCHCPVEQLEDGRFPVRETTFESNVYIADLPAPF